MTITINGTQHELAKDMFDISYIDGQTIDEFLDTCSKQDFDFLVKYGLKIVTEEPEYAKDIGERYEY